MVDIIDRAKDIEMGQRNAALLNQQAKADADNNTKPFMHKGYRACIDCLQPIPVERLKIRPNAERCVPCKQAKELLEKRGA